MNPKVKRLRQQLQDLGLAVKEFERTTKTAADAAAALNCKIEQIAKSIIFKDIVNELPVLAIISGKNKVDLKKLEKLTGFPLEKADADFVLQSTGFSIGGVPPFGYEKDIKVFLDEELFNFPIVWAAAGTPNSVFAITPEELLRWSKGKRADLKIET